MKYIFTIVAVFVTSIATFDSESLHFLSDEFINFINSKNTTWKAGRNFNSDTSAASIRQLLGVLPKKESKHTLPTKIHTVDFKAIPESFDAREAWPKCATIIGDIKDQGGCVAGWVAFAAVETISDRICIHSNATIQLSISVEDLLSCCSDCNYGCTGGHPVEGWYYWSTVGIVTGGKYGTTDGCRAYSIEPCDHYVDGPLDSCEFILYTPDCVNVCDDESPLEYKSDLRTGAPYYVVQSEAQIQTEIMTNGPVAVSFDVYEDFVSYKSGVYQWVSGRYLNGQPVKLIGWGVEDDVPYWLAANSWNEHWGDNGYFKVLRGSNECSIESEPLAGIPKF